MAGGDGAYRRGGDGRRCRASSAGLARDLDRAGPVVGKTEGWIEETVTLVVTEQRGSVFSGRKKYSDGEEAIYGAVSADGSTLLVVDDGDGQAIGKVLGPTSIEYCYAEAGADPQAYAAC